MTSKEPALSASVANTFLKCPLQFRFSYLDKIPRPATPAMLRGTLVHKVLENMFDLPAEQRTVNVVTQTINDAWQTVSAEATKLEETLAEQSADDLKAETLRLIEAYFTLENPSRLNPDGRESFVETVLSSGLRLRGIIDRVEVNPDGWVRITDYKSGKAPLPQYTHDYRLQMLMYSLLYRENRGVVPRRTQLLFLGGACPDVMIIDPTPEDVTAFEDEILDIWIEITKCLDNGHFAPHPSKLCEWCYFQNLCPVYDNTPPEVPAEAIENYRKVGPAHRA